MAEHLLYRLNNPHEIFLKTGKKFEKLQLLNQYNGLKKEDFVDAEKTASTMNLKKWHVEVRDTRPKDFISESPFEIEIYFVGPHGVYAHPLEVYLVED